LVDEKVWDEKSVEDTGNLILAIVYMSRANNESAAKSDRLSEFWGNKRKRIASGESKRIMTSECPRWLTPTEDKTGFEPISERVESIKKVFEHRIAGYGISSIVTRANKEAWPVPGKKAVRKSGESIEDYKRRSAGGMLWQTSTVGRLLKNRALLGEYQPHITDPDNAENRIPHGEPIHGYYPAVLDEPTFLRAQAKADRSGRFPGRRDASLKNWLQGILKCNCGHSMVRKNKNSEAQPGYARYYCTQRNLGKSDCPGASALELETAVLEVVSTVAPQFFKGTARAEELKARADMLEVDISSAKQTRDRFAEAIASTRAPVKTLTARIVEAEAAVEKLERELSKVRAELADLSGDFDTVFENIRRAVESVDSLDARAALREDLSRVMSKAVVHENDGYLEVHLRGESVPVVQRLREDGVLPGAVVVEAVAKPEGFVPGLPQGLTIAPLTREEQDAYVGRLEENGE
jgi:hypothetical protein